jgi:arginase
VRRCDGLTLEELSQVLKGSVATPNWRALTVTEVNPDHAPDEDEAFRRLISMLSATLPAQSANGRGGAAGLVGNDNASVATN